MDWHTLRAMVDAGEIPGARIRQTRKRTLRFVPVSQIKRLRGVVVGTNSTNKPN